MGESYYAACQSAQEQDMIEAKAVAPFLKDGEQPSECIKRWRADALAVLELLTQEKVKSETLAAEVAKLLAACAAKDEAICTLRDHITVGMYRAVPHLADVAADGLSTDAGKGWIDASGAVEAEASRHVVLGNTWLKDGGVLLPGDWAGATVLIVRKP